MTAGDDVLDRADRGVVEFIDVPEFGYVFIDGVGTPDGPDFAAGYRRCTW